LRELEVQFLGSSELAGCRRLDASPRHSEWLRRRCPPTGC
jgi:hypothetical protein